MCKLLGLSLTNKPLWFNFCTVLVISICLIPYNICVICVVNFNAVYFVIERLYDLKIPDRVDSTKTLPKPPDRTSSARGVSIASDAQDPMNSTANKSKKTGTKEVNAKIQL